MAQVRSLKTGIKFIDTPIGKIPVDWQVGTFSEIAEVNPKRDLKKEAVYPFVEMAAISSESHKIQFRTPRKYKGGGAKFKNKDTLFARITPCTENGKTAYVDSLNKNQFGHGSTEFIVLGPKDNINSKFIYYCAKWDKIRNIAISKMEGTSGRQRVPNRVFLEDIFVPIPPLSEQKKIAEILTTLDDAIEETDRIIKKTKELKKGLMQILLTRGIGHKKFKRTEIGEMPEKWEICPLEKLYKSPVRDFGSFSTTKLVKYVYKGVPFIRSENFKDGRFISDNLKYIAEDVHRLLTKSFIRKGNLLFTKIGNIGHADIYDGRFGECNSNATIAKIDINERKAYIDYIRWFLNSEIALKQFSGKIISTPPRINLGEISNIKIPLPSYSEQRKIASIFSSSETTTVEEENKKEKLEFLKKALMQVLLTGKIRVKLH